MQTVFIRVRIFSKSQHEFSNMEDLYVNNYYKDKLRKKEPLEKQGKDSLADRSWISIVATLECQLKKINHN